jgi:hypothetical protein
MSESPDMGHPGFSPQDFRLRTQIRTQTQDQGQDLSLSLDEDPGM